MCLLLKYFVYLCSPFGERVVLFLNRGVAQLASAPALGAGGPPFESEYPDRKSAILTNCRLFYLLEIRLFANYFLPL